ncbi:MAG TPA: hypothetical protein VGQ55_02430 [Pyrinomonadaceae bacterium]|nr:hypothetical protein [Pyrinomonadaceae bacterium]
MKKRVLLVIAVSLVFGLSAATFAYQQINTGSAASSCCKGDSCPMKNKNASSQEAASCCDKDDCCCKGDSCPMKKSNASTMSGAVNTENEDNGCSCCDSAKTDVAA